MQNLLYMASLGCEDPSEERGGPPHHRNSSGLGLRGQQGALLLIPGESSSIFLKIIIIIYLFLVVLGLRCCVTAFSLVAVSRGYYFFAVLRLLIAGASLVVARGLSCPTACGIFPE